MKSIRQEFNRRLDLYASVNWKVKMLLEKHGYDLSRWPRQFEFLITDHLGIRPISLSMDFEVIPEHIPPVLINENGEIEEYEGNNNNLL